MMKKNNWLKLITGVSLLLIVVGVISGCSGSTATDKKGAAKTLIFTTANEVNTLYPLNMDPQNFCVTKLVYEGLVDYENGEIKPLLAESWEFNEAGNELTFHLRSGVSFHDGTPFNAEAVKKNLDYFKKSGNHRALRAVTYLKETKVVDENTITLYYDSPYFAYLNDFCYPDVLVMVSPEVIEAGNYQTMKDVVGTGPYRYAEIINGESVRFERYPDYWGEAPYYETVVAKYIPESASRLQALKNGEVDMLYGSVLMTYDEYQQAIQMASIGGEISDHNSETRNLALNAGSVMLNDLKVREALAYAIDKEAISKGLTYGYEEVTETLFDEGIPYTDVELNTVRRFNLEKANALLDEAGWVKNASTGIREKDGVSLKLAFTYDSGEIMNKSIATLLKSQLSEVGIEVETVGQDMYTWWKEGIAGNYDITIWCTEQPYNSPHNFFTPMLDSSCHVPAIAALADGQTFTNAIKAFSTTDDPAQVTEIFSYLLNYSNDNVLNIPLTYVKDMIVYNTDKIEDYTFTTTPMFFEVDGITPAV